MNAAQNKATQSTETMQDYTLVRQGQPPLKFLGVIIGKGEVGNEQSSVTIRIYRTKGNLYVAEIERRNSRSPFNDVPPYRNAAHAPSPPEVINWLKEDEDTLGKASQDAVERACENDKEFAAAWVERIE